MKIVATHLCAQTSTEHQHSNRHNIFKYRHWSIPTNEIPSHLYPVWELTRGCLRNKLRQCKNRERNREAHSDADRGWCNCHLYDQIEIISDNWWMHMNYHTIETWHGIWSQTAILYNSQINPSQRSKIKSEQH